MTRLPPVLAHLLVPIVAVMSIASVATAQPIFNRAGDVNARDLSIRSLNAAATVSGTSLSTLVAQAAAALPAAQLANAMPLPAMATATRSLAARFSESLDVRDYGAKCDGSTDDTAAFRAAIAVATGQLPVGGSPTQFASIIGIGANPNGSAKIIVPAGACMLSGTLVANTLKNSGFAMVGDGTSHTELVWSNSGDGLDVNFAPNSAGNDLVHNGSNYPGQALLIKGIKFSTAFVGASNTGVALNIKAIPLVLSNVAPTQVIEDVAFTNRAGWSGATQGWAVGLRFTDPDFLYINRAISIDLRQFKTAGFQIVSDTPTGGTGHGNIICQDCTSYGGSAFFDISGRAVQAVWLERPFWVEVNTGITWLSGVQQTNGSLSIHAASGGAALADVHVSNIGTVFSQGNFYYPNTNVAGTNWYGEWLDGVDWVNISGDTITAPPAGTQGNGATTYNAYGLVLNQGANGAGVYDGLPSLVSGVSVAGADYAISAQGPNVLVNGAVCAPNSGNGRTTVCFQNSYTGSDVRFNPHFENVVTTDNLIYADAGHDTVVHGSYGQMFGAGFELGMPGITIPGVGPGYPGLIDFHSTASPDGSIARLNDYDCRMASSGGTQGTAGLGTMNLTCKGGLIMNGNVTDTSIVPIGASNGATITAVDNTSGEIMVCASSSTTLATLTFVMPPTPRPKQVYHLTAECTITALTVSPSTGSSILGAPTTISPTTPVAFVYDNDRSLWTRW
jgi:hypothetical protein